MESGDGTRPRLLGHGQFPGGRALPCGHVVFSGRHCAASERVGRSVHTLVAFPLASSCVLRSCLRHRTESGSVPPATAFHPQPRSIRFDFAVSFWFPAPDQLCLPSTLAHTWLLSAGRLHSQLHACYPFYLVRVSLPQLV